MTSWIVKIGEGDGGADGVACCAGEDDARSESSKSASAATRIHVLQCRSLQDSKDSRRLGESISISAVRAGSGGAKSEIKSIRKFFPGGGDCQRCRYWRW